MTPVESWSRNHRTARLRVVGDPDHSLAKGALCGKCSIVYNGIWRDPNARLTRPLKRVGPKGKGRFEPVSWDEALGDIAARLNTIRANDGGGAILQTHYTGTCSLIAGVFPMRLFNRIGATEVDPDTVCNKAGHAALQLMYGYSTRGFDPRTIDGSRCLMIWGANPSASAPHVHQHWVTKSGVPTIVVDPDPPRDRGCGRHPPAALSRHRRRARVRHAACHPRRRLDRLRVP